MSASAPSRTQTDEPPRIEVLVDEGVGRALAGIPLSQLRLRLTVEAAVASSRLSEDRHEFDADVEAFLIARAPLHAHLAPDVASVLLQAELLEAFDVPMGDKSVAIFMHRAWTSKHASQHGAALAPPTLRHWRRRLRSRDPIRGGVRPGGSRLAAEPVANPASAD